MMSKTILTMAMVVLTNHAFALDQNQKKELYEIVKETGYNYCFILINKDQDRRTGLNHFKISPTSACQCTSIEAANSMEVSPLYHAYLRNLIRHMNINKGLEPPFEYEEDQDQAVNEYSRIFNNSWANCFMRLKKS